MSFRKIEGNEEERGKRVILLHNFKDSEVKEFLELLKNSNLSRSIVAVTTDISLEWKVRDLMDELIKEDDEIKRKSRR
ncbi:MAG: DUF3783 domain-containing protein [Thermoplasmata archaeon]|jgi:hypothetical protein|nr:DUF3783 domain-containing protein [Thermoplasmata archaeon]MVT13606.1 DUF3783 domain-containing protein [Euryarchaeota archaeon]MVT15057.1 DUF3783 domain-containing protein [Euryarchaeota archaeon]MVT36228.1 DUF3783 domain-containing protein [Euryarchaeota archaeon]